MIKVLLLVVIMSTGLDFDVKQYYNRKGYSLIYVVNNEPFEIYCWIESRDYFVDFYVKKGKSSRPYYEPATDYSVICEES